VTGSNGHDVNVNIRDDAWIVTGARAVQGGSVIAFYSNASRNGSKEVMASGKIPLASEPTTYTTAANMEGVQAVDVYIPPASATESGLVTTGAQTIAGVKTFTDAPVIANATGIVAASATVPGVITTGAQTVAGAKTFSSLVTGSLGFYTGSTSGFSNYKFSIDMGAAGSATHTHGNVDLAGGVWLVSIRVAENGTNYAVGAYILMGGLGDGSATLTSLAPVRNVGGSVISSVAWVDNGGAGTLEVVATNAFANDPLEINYMRIGG
jgi:hypothetical protein